MMKDRIKFILVNSGFKDIAVLSSGVVVAQMLSFIFQPIATRLYSAAAFGVLSVIISVVSIMAPVITLQYHMGIVTAKTDKEANNLCALTFYLIGFIGLITSIGLVIYTRISPNTFAEAGIWLYAAIPLLLMTGLVNVVDSYNNRFGQYKLMASVSVQRSLVSNVLKIALGVLNSGNWGLVVSQVVSVIFGVRKQGQYIITKYKEILSSSFEEMKEVAFKHKAQPLFSTPGLFVITFSYSILPIFISSLYSIDEVGYFSISVAILGLPLNLISSNVARIFFRNAAVEREEKGNFSTSFQTTSILLVIISIIGFSILWFVAEPLFSFVYGAEWARSGLFVKILIPMYASRFIVTSLMHGFIVSNKQNLKLFLQSFFILGAVVIYLFVRNYNVPIETFLTYINIAYSVNYLVLFFALYKISSQND